MAVDIAELGLTVRSDGIVVATERLKKLGKAANDAEDATERLRKQAEQASKSAKKWGKNMSLYVTAPLLAAAAASIKLGVEFESTLAKMNTLVGVSRRELAQFRKEILALGPSVGRGPRELAEALFAITSAGQRGAQAMDTLKKAAMASAIGLGDTRTIALAATAATQAYGEANMNSTKALEILIGTIEQGNLEASSLAPVLGRVIGIAAELGVAFEDLGGFIATFTRLGVNADEAATALRSTLATLQKPTEEAHEAFALMGTSIEEVRRQIKEGGVGSFTQVFQDLVKRSREFNVDLVSLVPNVRALSGVLGVFGGEGKVAIEVTDGVAKAVGTLGDRYQAVIDLDPSHQIAMMRAELESTFVLLSEDLVPVFLTMVNALREMMAAFNELDETTQKAIVTFMTFAAVIGPFLLLFGSLAGMFAKLIPWLGRMGVMIGPKLAGFVARATTAITGPAGLAAALTMVTYELARFVDEAEASAIEETINNTVLFTAALGELREEINALTMESNILAVGNEIAALERDIAGAVGRIAALRAQAANPNTEFAARRMINAELEKEVAAHQVLVSEMESLIRLRDEYTQRLSDSAAAALEEARILEEITTNAARRDMSLSEGDAEKLQALLDKIDPIAAATRKWREEQDLLDASLLATFQKYTQIDDQGRPYLEITEEVRAAVAEHERLSKLLADSYDEEGAALAELVDELDPAAAAMRELEKRRKMLAKALAKGDLTPDQFERLSYALERSELAMAAFAHEIGAFDRLDQEIMAGLEGSIAYIESLETMELQVQALADSLDPLGAELRRLEEAKKLLNEAFDAGIFEGQEDQFYRLRDAIDAAADSLTGIDAVMRDVSASWVPALRDMAQMFDRDSQEAKDLHRVIIALQVAEGILAVIRQLSSGDPYSAIPRAIAVAAMIASMGVQTGAAGGASRQSLSERRQDEQGAGSVLGDAAAKTESIMKASEITATATSELVGINRGMLNALRALQAGLVGATRSIARGGEIDPTMPNVDMGLDDTLMTLGALGGMILGPLGALIGGALGWALGKLLGGKAKVIDRGVAILSGNLQDAIDGALVQAFATIKFKKWRYGSSKRREELQPLADEASTQIALIFQAIGDTVYEGAIALGMSADAVEEAINSFIIAEQRISLEGLTAEEAQAELEAVFGEIFDDLAAYVVPWLGQFQLVGEGLGETLVRVATSVQVFQEAVKTLGFAANITDPEAFARMAVGLVELTGGVEEFVRQFSSFFETFASDEQKLAFLTDHLSRAFDSVGLTLPSTRDEIWGLMESLDATTEAGRAQIAMLLELTPLLDDYYGLIDSAERERLRLEEERLQAIREYNDWLQQQRDIIDGFTGFDFAALRQLEADFDAAMAAARALGASTRETALIMSSFELQMQRLRAQTQLNVMSIADQLFGEDRGLDVIDDGLEETREVANRVFDEWMRALEDIYEFTQSILLDEDLTTLTPAEQLAEAERQFNQLLIAARGGDVEAAAALPDAADALLEEARFMYASGAAYQRIFDATLAALKSIQKPADVTETITETIDVNIDYRRQGQEIGGKVGEELERLLMALDLVESLRHLGEVTGRSIFDLADELNIPLREWMEALGIDLDVLTSETAQELANIANALGVGFQDLIAALGIGMDAIMKVIDIDVSQKWAKVMREAERWADMLGVSIKAILRSIDYKTPEFRSPREKSKYYDKVIKDPLYKKGYATGGYVGQSGLAMVHAGEFVIDKNQNTIAPANDSELTAAELAQIKTVLVDIREQDRRYHEADIEASREIGAGVKQQAEQIRRAGNG